MTPSASGYLSAAVERDIAAGLYFGGVISIQRGGQPAFLKAFGHSSEAKQRAVALDSVFSLFSVTKAFTNMLVFQAIERGLLTLTTPIAKVIPEFGGGLRNRITVFHLLTHSAGLPSMFEARPGMYIDRHGGSHRRHLRGGAADRGGGRARRLCAAVQSRVARRGGAPRRSEEARLPARSCARTCSSRWA